MLLALRLRLRSSLGPLRAVGAAAPPAGRNDGARSRGVIPSRYGPATLTAAWPVVSRYPLPVGPIGIPVSGPNRPRPAVNRGMDPAVQYAPDLRGVPRVVPSRYRAPAPLPPRRPGLLLALARAPAAPVARPRTGWLYDPPVGGQTAPAAQGGAFPTQYLGLRYQGPAGVVDLCLVATADAPAGVGGQVRVRRTADTLAAYLVDVSDPDASPVRVRTGSGTYAIRRKT